MKNKLISLIVAVVIIIGGFVIAGALSKPKAIPHRKKSDGNQKVLQFATVKLQEVPVEISVGGTLRALNKIDLFAEVSGILHQAEKPFRAGVYFRKGETLLRIDDQVYRNNVLAQKSSLLNQLTRFLPDFAIDFPQSAKRWEAYLNAFDLNGTMAPLPQAANAKEQYFIASRNIYNLYYSVKSMEATLDKYTIRAPYNGVVTEYTITAGTLVRAGQKLGEFTSAGVFELEIPVNVSDLPFVNKGDRAVLLSDDIKGVFSGRVSRINAKIDRASQTVMAYVTVQDNRLKDGMYLTARIASQRKIQGFKIPAVWLIDKNQLYVKRDSNLVLTKVEIMRNENDFVIVNGLKDGTQILAQEFSGRTKTVRLD